MKYLMVLSALLLVLGVAGTAQAQVNNLNEQGSILVFPLIDNIYHRTIIEICNRSNSDVWLQGFMIVHPKDDPYNFVKKDFLIHLTQKEPFWWDTSRYYSRYDAHGYLTQLQSFDYYKGFCFVWAIDDDKDRLEIDWDYLLGDAVVYTRINGGGESQDGSRAFEYNAIPHQGLNVIGDRVLNLDGVEYTMATSQVMVKGFAEGVTSDLGGKFVVCSLDIDFINSIQPKFDINFDVWNQNEVYFSRHLDFYQFEQYDLTDDLQLHINQIFTPKFCFATTSTDALWCVFYQYVPLFSWGGNVWQHPNTGVPATVILSPIPEEK